MWKAINKFDKFIMSLSFSHFKLRDRRGLKSYEKNFAWPINIFKWLRFSPNLLTVLAVFFAMLGGGFILYELRYAAVGCFFAAWFLTYFDGIYARQTAAETKYGEFLNLFANILCEVFLFVPLLISCIFSVSHFLVAILLLLLILRVLIWQVLLQASSLKIKTPEVLFNRTELWLVFVSGILFDWLEVTIICCALLLLFSLVYILVQIYRALVSKTVKKIKPEQQIKPRKKK